LDYSLDALISQIRNLDMYNWFFSHLLYLILITCSYMSVLTTRFLIHIFRFGFIDTFVSLCMPLGHILQLVG